MSLFPSPIAQSYPPPKPKPASNRRTIILILVFSGIAILAVGAYALYRAGSWYSRRYLNIDQSQATFVATDEESVYRNPAYGVTLRLPGRWARESRTPVGHYCQLRQLHTRAFAGFRTQFVSPQQNMDQFTGALVFGLAKRGSYKLISQESLTVNGRTARQLTFEYTLTGELWRMVMLLMNKAYNLYQVTLVGPVGDDDSWKELVESLSHAVEIQ
ncbi:MAG TPA: hypothetical protein VF860_08630 [Candidatus Acidoferrales bacterium]